MHHQGESQHSGKTAISRTAWLSHKRKTSLAASSSRLTHRKPPTKSSPMIQTLLTWKRVTMGTARRRSTFENTSHHQTMQTQPQESSTSTLESPGKTSKSQVSVVKITRFVTSRGIPRVFRLIVCDRQIYVSTYAGKIICPFLHRFFLTSWADAVTELVTFPFVVLRDVLQPILPKRLLPTPPVRKIIHKWVSYAEDTFLSF
jgi:hypothetical protein